MNKSILKELKDVRLISLGIILIVYIITFSFLFMFAAIGLAESEKQVPHAFDGHKYLNYNTFDSFMKISPMIGVGILIGLVLLIASFPRSKQPKENGVEQ